VKTILAACAGSLRSIKTQVTLAALGALVASIAITSLVLVREAERETLRTHRDRELHDVARSAALLSRRVVELQKVLASTAELLDPATLHDGKKLAALFAAQPVLRGMFSNVFAAAADGTVLGLADDSGMQRPVLNLAGRDYFQRTLAERRPMVSGAVASRVSNAPIIVVTAPLRNARGVYGVIGGTLLLASRDLVDDVVDGGDGDAGRLVVVTDARGQILAHPQRSRIMQSISNEPQMADGYSHWLSLGGSSGGAIEPSGLFVQQPGQVLAVAGVAGPDWLVWHAVPVADLLAPLHAARTQVLVWAAAIVAGASLLVLALMRRLLQPLVQLQHRAAHLFDGTSDLHAGWPAVGGEIGELARVLRHVGAERAQLEQFNAQVMAKLNSVMTAAPLGIIFTRSQTFELVSREACKLLGRSEQALLGQQARTIYASSDDYDALGPQVGAAFCAGRAYVGEWRFLRADGSSFWGQLRGHPVEAGNSAAGTIWTLADIGEHVEQREQLEWSASHDPLTGLGNRKLLEQRLARVLGARPGSLPAAVVMIDLDRFKPINDGCGHAAGDAMLKAVAAAILAQVRTHDLVARIGGDEFALLLEECPVEAAQRIAHSVLDAVSAIALAWDGQVLRVGASLGVAPLAASTASMAGWLQEADAACYQAKAAGRGNVVTVGSRALRLVNAPGG
jgi:diguanylate cyclase (GGDEF)-like protein/PAS domain S-box-containing protein